MFRFVSSKNSVQLKRAYLAKYNVDLLQRKLDKLMANYPDIKTILPKDINAKKLLVGNFKYLVKVYIAFACYLRNQKDEERDVICQAFKNGGFSYESHKTKIADFLMDTDNGFEIHNCVYCDLEDVTTFIRANGSKVRKFETEHVLDKGACPLVALSLYNFVPSCKTCNGPDIKGAKTLGDTIAEMVELSPSAEGYDFDRKVSFEVKILTPGAADLNMATHPDDCEIDFNIRDNIYKKSIDFFELKSRYNTGITKIELLQWRDKRRCNPDNIIQQFADIKKITFKEAFEEMFSLDLRKRQHYPMEKARREVMML